MNLVIQKATLKDPNHRYEDALSMAVDLRRALAGNDLMDTTPITSERVALLADIGLDSVENPYKGLRAFEEADADDLFGREKLVDTLIERMQESSEIYRFLAVVGPSGSGKSSVVKGGLLPRLRRDTIPGSSHWFIAELVPGPYPLEELEIALTRVAAAGQHDLRGHLERDERGLLRASRLVLPDDQSELLLVIDQFEELFTQAGDNKSIAHFLALLQEAVSDSRSRVRVLVTLRADFYDRPLRVPGFSSLIQQRTEVVLPLNSEELERAIVGPAERVGVRLEPALIASIITDVNEQPGALPLLQYALTELFEHREGHLLTLEAYNEIGGTLGALAKRAEQVYDWLDTYQQSAARQLFLRLVTLGEGTEDTRRRVRQSELISAGGDVMNQAISVFDQSRLLTFDRDPITRAPTVEVAHEALIREWNRLRAWLDESRADLRQHRLLNAATNEWLRSDKDDSYLLRGSRLEQFEAWAGESEISLTDEEREYINSSMAEREVRSKEERARQARERELERQVVNRLRLLVGVFLIAAMVAGGLGLLATRSATAARSAAETARAAEAEAEQARQQAEFQAAEIRALLLVSESDEALDARNTDTALSLALAADNIVDAEMSPVLQSLERAAFAPGTRLRLTGHDNRVASVAVSGNGQMIASGAADGTIRLWALDTGDVIATLPLETELIRSLAFSPDSRRLAAGTAEGWLVLWDVTSEQRVWQREAHPRVIRGLDFTPDGAEIISGGADGQVLAWDAATGEPQRTLYDGEEAINDLAVSPSGRALAVASGSDVLFIRMENGVLLRRVREGDESLRATVRALAFSPSGDTVVTGDDNATVRMWEFGTGRFLWRAEGHISSITSVAFEPDGNLVVSTSGDAVTPLGDNTIRVWDGESGEPILLLRGHTDRISDVEFAPEGIRIVTSSFDNTLRVWDVRGGQEVRRYLGHEAPVLSLAVGDALLLSGSGRGGLSAPPARDNDLRLWDIATGQLLRQFVGHDDAVLDVALSEDASIALSGSADGTAIVWDVLSGQHLHTLQGHNSIVMGVALDPGGNLAATGGFDRTLRLWDIETGTLIGEPLQGHDDWVKSVAFSPDGTQVLSGSADSRLILWDVTTGEQIRTFSAHFGQVEAVAFSPDGATIASGSADGRVLLWETATGDVVRELEAGAEVNAVQFNDLGNHLLAGAANGELFLWDVGDGTIIEQYTAHRDAVNDMTFTRDFGQAVSASHDETLRLWQLPQDYDDLITWIARNRYVAPVNCDDITEELCESILASEAS